MLTEDAHDAISSRLLDQLERIQAELTAAHSNKRLRRKLEREDYVLRQAFAKHLMIEVDRFDLFSCENYKSKGFYEKDRKKVRAYRRVDGVPNKKGKIDAAAWMAGRNVDWNGSAPDLRREIHKALENGEALPDGYFGLHVEWTVEIETVEWLIFTNGTSAHWAPGPRRYS
jgi:hypothetical protein